MIELVRVSIFRNLCRRYVDGVSTAGIRERLDREALRNRAFEEGFVRCHFDKIKSIDEIHKDTNLFAKEPVAAAWLRRRINKGAILVTCCERVVEVVVKPATSKEKLPGFDAVRQVVGAAKARFVVTNHLVQSKIESDGRRRGGIMEIENGNSRMGIFDFLGAIGDVL